MANSKALATLASTHIHDTIYLLKHCLFFFSFPYVLCLVLECIIIIKSAKYTNLNMKSESDSALLLAEFKTTGDKFYLLRK